jgi:hypothetical protein
MSGMAEMFAFKKAVTDFVASRSEGNSQLTNLVRAHEKILTAWADHVAPLDKKENNPVPEMFDQ